MKEPMRVVLVEDSPTQARAIARLLEAEGDISVTGTPATAPAAVEQVRALRPDVVVMDLDIPDGGGQVAIDRIMADSPTPILVLSGTFARSDAPVAVAALAAGAVEAIPKPQQWTSDEAVKLRRMVRRVRGVAVIGRRSRPARGSARPAPRTAATRTGAVVAIAASTGGPAAVSSVLVGLKGIRAPILVVQHIHAGFAEAFAKWLEGATGMTVHLVSDRQQLQDGCVYVVAGDMHLRLDGPGVVVADPEPHTLHRPSADVLFESVAQHAGPAGIGVVLTGMGNDGARGLAALRAAGGTVFAQDEASSVVFGMPQAAVRSGAAQHVVALADIPSAIRRAAERGA